MLKLKKIQKERGSLRPEGNTLKQREHLYLHQKILENLEKTTKLRIYFVDSPLT